jgi:hypothetical protein
MHTRFRLAGLAPPSHYLARIAAGQMGGKISDG